MRQRICIGVSTECRFAGRSVGNQSCVHDHLFWSRICLLLPDQGLEAAFGFGVGELSESLHAFSKLLRLKSSERKLSEWFTVFFSSLASPFFAPPLHPRPPRAHPQALIAST
jgi:hypothetical protein